MRRRLGGERLNLANECKVITANSGHAYEINKQKISFVLKVSPEKLALETGQKVHDHGSVSFFFQRFL